MKWYRNLFACACAAFWLLANGALAETVVWSDNFETNAASHWSANTVWKISAPTAGPPLNGGFRAHSGAVCAHTQNYRPNTDGRTICSSYNGHGFLTIPPVDQHPRLRFWHWFNIANGLGFVEISTNNGADWNQISPTYQNSLCSGVWSRPEIDLGAYAGREAQFAFRFFGASPGNNSYGWYVDDIAVVTSADPPTLGFPESFEFDPKMSDWSVGYGTWEIGRPASGPNRARTGTNCAATVLGGSYGIYVDSQLVSPPFRLPESGDIILHFWHWYAFNNALGFVEINDNTVNTVITTNVTITTNVATTLNTNIYQLYGAAIAGYDTNFAWNPDIRCWTNATKAMGNIFDSIAGTYFFEAGNAPFFSINGGNYDYRANNTFPVPRSAAATNFAVWQGMIWNSRLNSSDNPVGYFGTNYTYTYKTNTTIVVSQTTWNQISATFQNGSTGGAWREVALDLSDYAGKTVQLAFHFGSGGTSGAGWYVDDLSIAAAPIMGAITNPVVNFGQQFTLMLTATNPISPASIFKFALAAPSTNVTVKTNGLVTWTGTNTPPGTYSISVKVTDNNTPPLSDTNTFSATVRPLPSQLSFANPMIVTNDGRSLKFSVTTPWTNNTWVILAGTNLTATPTNWLPIFTNHGGLSTVLVTDRLSTNFLQRYYRAVFQ